MVVQRQKDELRELFGGKAKPSRAVKKRAINQRSLEGLVLKKTPIYRNYKGKHYTATLNPDGTIMLKSKKYSSATAAAKAVVDRSSVNGWHFWYIEDVNGDKVKLYKFKE